MIAPALGHGLSFNDLYDRDGLARLDAAFAGWLQTANVDVHARLMAARTEPDQLADKDESNLLIEVARPLEDFLGALFGVTREATELRARHNALAPLYDCKRLFVQRYVARTIKPDAASKPGSLPSRWPFASCWARTSRSRRRRRRSRR
jgi:hypothetical protein